MSDYTKWGEARPRGSQDSPVPGQGPLARKAADPVKAIFATEATAAQIEAKVDTLLQPPAEGEDTLTQVVELLETLVSRVDRIEQRQARLEKIVVTTLDAMTLSLAQVAAALRTSGLDVPLPGTRPTSRG